MIGLSSLNPYMLYIKLGLIALAVAGLFRLGWHEMSIRADLKAKTVEAALQKATADQNARQFGDYIRLNKEIADAIQSIKIRSNNYIQTIEQSQPVVADGDRCVLIPAGVPAGVPVHTILPPLPGFRNNSASRAPPGPAGSPGNQAGG